MTLSSLLYALCQMKLNCIDPKVFPLPYNITSGAQKSSEAQPSPAQTQPAGQLQATAQPGSESQLAGSNLMKYILRPAARVDTVEHVAQALSVSEVQAELRTGPRQSLTPKHQHLTLSCALWKKSSASRICSGFVMSLSCYCFSCCNY